MALSEGEKETGGQHQELKNKKLSEEQMMKTIVELQNRIQEIEKSNAGPPAGQMAGLTAKDIHELVKAITKGKEEEHDLSAGVVAEKIPLDDWDEKGAVFFCPFAGYVISGDMRQGHPVKLPWGKKSIFFEHPAQRRFRQGKYEGLSYISTYTSHSKKEIEWLRSHTFFNINFYETTKAIANIETEKATKISEKMSYLKHLDHSDLMKRAKEYNVPANVDAHIMRTQIAYAMYEKELETEAAANKNRVMEVEKTKALLEQN